MDIKLLPLEIFPKDIAGKLFGIKALPLTLNPQNQIYYFSEPNGIIRAGVTVEFYKENKKYFFHRETYKGNWI